MKKKIIALVISMTMVMGMSLGAFAAETETISAASENKYAQDVTVTNTITTPTIKITVPTEAKVVLNPYKIKTTIDANGGAAKVTDSTDVIVSPVYTIKNESNVAIECSATVSAEAATGMTLATAALKGNETTKSVFLYLEAKDTAWKEAFAAANTNQVAVATKPTTKVLATLGEGVSAGAKTVEYKFAGGVASKPATAWANTDILTVKLTWTFVPVLSE